MKTTLRSARQSSSASWASPFVTAVVLALSSAAHAENVAPTDISLSSSSIEENNAANATVGTLTATDEDAGDTHTFSLVSGDGDTDNASFTIAGDELKLSPVADYESKTNYSVRVQADDGNGGTFAKALSVTINNVIETPMVTSPTSTSITATGATLGGEVSAASDPGTEIGIVYSLTADNGDPLIGDTGVTKVTGSGTTGVFTVGVTGLTAGTGYTFKAYASNTAGTGYSAPATFTTEKISQTITFTNPGSKTYGAAPFGLVATGGDSGNAVTFSIVTGPASVSGSTLTITGAGDVTVRASQAGNDTYSAAPDVEQTFTVAAKELTLANAAVAIKPYDGNTAATITGTLSGIVGSDDVTFVGTGTFASSAIGTGISVTAAITLAGADAGNYTFTQPTGLTGTIVAGQITFSPVDYAAAQSDGSVTLTLVRDGGPAATVTLHSEDGTAIAGTDYTDLDGTVINFAAGETSKPVTVTLIPNHAANAPDRVFSVSIGSVTGGTAGADDTATISILSPQVTVTAPTQNASVSDRPPYTVGGTASDLHGISRVTVSLNGGSAVDATLGAVDSDFNTPILQWAPAGGVSSEGQLDVSRIPATTTTPVVFSSVNGQDYDVQVTTGSLGGSSFINVPDDSSWSLQGTTSGASTVQLKFFEAGTSNPLAFTKVRFRFDDAEQYEVFANFSYFDETGDEIPLLWNNSVFSYSHSPIYNTSRTEVENGAPPESSVQNGKWVQVNLGSTPVTGFKFSLRRKSSSQAGSVIMGAVNGTSSPTGTEFSLNATPWSLAIEPISGSNTMVVTAYDLDDNAVSLTRAFNFTRRYQLAVRRTAPTGIALDTAGTVSLTASPLGSATALSPTTANANPRTSDVVPGTTTVTLTATPKTGYIFTSWTGLPSGATVLGNVASFAMPAEDTEVSAGFQVADVFTGSAGSGNAFGGLLLPEGATATGNDSVGYFSGTLASTGVFSGRVMIDGITQTFAATFFGDGSSVFTVGATKQGTLTIGGRTLTLSYNAGAGNDAITATLKTNGTTTNSGVAGRSIYSGANLIPANSPLLNTALTSGGANTRGIFTVALPAQVQSPPLDASTYPQGDGYLTLTLTNAGAVTGTGVLADGTAVTLSSTLISGNQCLIFVQLATPGQAATVKGGAFLGTLVFDTTQANTDVSGTGLLWLRPDVSALTPISNATAIAAAKLYTGGWPSGIRVNAAGALYDKSKTVQASLDLDGDSEDLDGNPLAYEDGKLVLEQGKLASIITKQNFIVSGNTVTKLPATDNTFFLAPLPTTGAFSGTFKPNWALPSSVLPVFKGILIQKGANRGGHGFFISNVSGDNDPEAGDVDFTVEPYVASAPPVATSTPATVSATAPYTLTGTAGNARGLARVEVSLNGANAVNAALGTPTATGSVPYSLSISPSIGQNTIVITAVDLRGNRSSTTLNLTFNQRFILTLSRSVPDGLSVDSVGTVALSVNPAAQATALTPTTANANPRTAQVQNGATVTLTATPKTGYAFVRWTGLPMTATVTGNVASFSMPTSNLNVAAEFASSSSVFAGTMGTGTGFFGLIRPETGTDTSNATVGFLTGTLNASTGVFTGSVLVDGVSQAINATFYGDGSPIFTVGTSKTKSLSFGGRTLSLSLNTTGAKDQIAATLTTAAGTSSGVAKRAIYSATNSFATSGTFTVALPAKVQDPAVDLTIYPQGDGFATLTLTSAGSATITGTLADNTAFTATTALVDGNEAPFLAQVLTPGSTTAKGGSFSGTLQFDLNQADSDLTATNLLWIRPAVTQQSGTTAAALATQPYTSGWPAGITVDAVGARYDNTQTVQASLGLGAVSATAGNGKLQFADGKLTTGITKTNFNINGSAVAKIPTTDKTFTLTATASTGAFSGTILPNWTPTAAALPTFKGIILQKGANRAGFGFFLSNIPNDTDPESGGVSLSKQP